MDCKTGKAQSLFNKIRQKKLGRLPLLLSSVALVSLCCGMFSKAILSLTPFKQNSSPHISQTVNKVLLVYSLQL